tara:strand:+ start:367 stop:693 length:327 start_codon:yes stop_codon:yes gene_type:complete
MRIIVNILGITGAVCIAISLFPQTIKTIQQKSMNEISIPFVCVTMVGASCQLLYGIYYNIIPMIIANVCVLCNTVILITYKIYLLIYNGSPSHLVTPIELDRNLSCNA